MGVFLTALVIASAALPAAAQQFGAAENLGPAIPTPQFLVDRMLEAGRVKSGDVVYDLEITPNRPDLNSVIGIAREIAAEKVGSELKLLVDQPLIARTEADAPDVDARVILSEAASVGEFVRRKIVGTRGYDLVA